MNTFGRNYRFTSYGESHGPAIGGVIDGCPAGLRINTEHIRHELSRRRTGQSPITSQRHETDEVEFLSGLLDGITTGAPIAFMMRNEGQRSSDYEAMKNVFRPSHADYTYQVKYGIRDYRGGGRSSARETAARVVAGAIAKQWLQPQGIRITAYTSQVGPITTDEDYSHYDLTQAEANSVRCPDKVTAEAMATLINEAQKRGDSIGGTITCVVSGVPAGIGDPIFGKLQVQLAAALFSINAVKGFDYGCGFRHLHEYGSQLNDAFCLKNGHVSTRTNHSGGIQGGISNGQDIYFRVAFKPTPTLFTEQETLTTDGHSIRFKAQGRHDPCLLPRAVPVVEAMTAITLADALLEGQTRKAIQ